MNSSDIQGEFSGWQNDVLELMNEKNEDRIINIVYGCDTSSKSTFLYVLVHEEPKRFLVLKSVSEPGEFIFSILEGRRSGWTGDSIIFDLSESEKIDQSTLEIIKDKFFIPPCHNIWIFSEKILDSSDDWNVFGIMFRREIPYLIRMTQEEAREIYF